MVVVEEEGGRGLPLRGTTKADAGEARAAAAAAAAARRDSDAAGRGGGGVLPMLLEGGKGGEGEGEGWVVRCGALDGEVFPRTKVVWVSGGSFWLLSSVVVVFFDGSGERGRARARGDSLLADHLRTNGVVGMGGWVPGGWVPGGW